VPDLSFKVDSAEPQLFAAGPTLLFRVCISNSEASECIHSVALRCQIQIDVTRRHYSAADQSNLRDLFGERERWGQTLKNILWTHINVVTPGFQGRIAFDLPVLCTFDFNVATTKYFHGLNDGTVPLVFLFSGTIFSADPDGALQATPIPWDKESSFSLPIKVWREMMDHYYPNTAWLCLRRDIFERLYQYKVVNGIATWEQVLDNLIPSIEEVAGR
jgi:hypothetical protein